MKFALIIILSLSPALLFCQKDIPKNSIGYGIGYYADVMQFLNPGYGDKPDFIKDNPKVYGKLFNGLAMRCGYERVLMTSFILSADFYMAKVNSYYNDPLELYWNKRKSDYYFVSAISFSKDLLKSESLTLMPVVGLLFRQIHSDDIVYQFEIQDDNLVILSIPEIERIVMKDLGLCFGMDFRYNFNNRVFTGLSLRSNLIFDIGIESLYVAPVCGVRF